MFDKTSNILSVTGNISGNYFLGNGSQLTGIAGAYGNTEVAAYLSSGNVTTAINTTSTIRSEEFVCHEQIKRELKRILIYECRCNERLKGKDEGSTRLYYY